MEPIVSVIVPAYNASKTINKCIDSILNQTLKDIEIIVINDCSQDNTLEILKEYKNKIILIDNEKNLGPAGSRNKGLDIAKGKYIGFVDSDDWIDQRMYELMSQKMSKRVDLVACSRFNVTKAGQKKIINTSTETNAKAFTETSNYNCDKLFKRSIIEKYKLRLPEEYFYAEDFAFGIRYKFYAKEMRILKEPLYYYLADSEGSITNSYKRNLLNIINVLEDMNAFFKQNNAFEKYENELIKISTAFYARRIREFKNFSDKKLQREFVTKFLEYFKKNYDDYKKILKTYNTTKPAFYRNSKILMYLYIEYVQIRRKLKRK